MAPTYEVAATAGLQSYPCLSKGIDSNVYRVGEEVVKEYQHLSLSRVERYVALQHRAAEVLAERPYRATIDLQGRKTELVAAEVVPVRWIGLSAAGKATTVSRYVEATNLEKLLWRPERFRPYREREIGDPDLARFASDLNAFFWDEYPTRAQDELLYHTCMLSRALGRALDVYGLYISKYNVKLQPSSEAGRIDLVVTDLALYIERIQEAAP